MRIPSFGTAMVNWLGVFIVVVILMIAGPRTCYWMVRIWCCWIERKAGQAAAGVIGVR